MNNKFEYIIIHHSASEWGSAREIRRWHLKKGWINIGYHFVILNGQMLPDFKLICLSGSIELGRDLDGDQFVEDNEVGAHALGYNFNSIGVCGIGNKAWTFSQEASLIVLCRQLMEHFNISVLNVRGHNETEAGKASKTICPNLDMAEFRKKLII